MIKALKVWYKAPVSEALIILAYFRKGLGFSQYWLWPSFLPHVPLPQCLSFRPWTPSWDSDLWAPVPWRMNPRTFWKPTASLALNPGSRPTLWTHLPACLSQNNKLHPVCSKCRSYILSNLITYHVCFKVCNGSLFSIAEFSFCLSGARFVQRTSQDGLTALTAHPKFVAA